ncbi:MAG TPA: ethanolamine ammonia-lyase reactivating factor EutA, partial [Chloroflexota bacterium]
MSRQFSHEHAGAGVHEHGPGETHSHMRESFEAHGHFHEEDLEALMAQDMSIDEADISGINPGWMVLNSVGIDIGSSTSHLTFSRLYLERRGLEMSSRFVTVRRDVLYRSPILLTSYVDIETIDVDRLSAFVEESYDLAGLDPSQIHTGAVICTGEAVKKKNS